jgi:DNA-binding transcriptional LysR family regulator
VRKNGLSFRKLEMVEAVAKLGSISAAARALDVSQPALTQGLKAVEGELGISLFKRDTSSLVPTPFAKPFLTYVDRIRAELLATRRDIEPQKPSDAETRLRISGGIRSCAVWINRAVETLQRLKPELSVTVDYDLLNLYTRLIEGEVDIGVSMVDLLPENAPGLSVEPLGRWRAIFIAGPEHPLAASKDLTLEQLRAYPLAGHFNYPVILRLFGEQAGTGEPLDVAQGWPTSSGQVDTLGSLIDLVASRDCLAIIAAATVQQELAEGTLIELTLMGNPQLYVQLVLAYVDTVEKKG